jgi:hypothetical protein
MWIVGSPGCWRCSLFVLALAPLSCHSTVDRYIVTVTPIDVGVSPSGLCVAVDPKDQHGLWWWEPGHGVCSSRSSGPGLFHAEDAIVSQAARSGPVALSFRLGTHSQTRPFVDVRLTVDEHEMRSLDTDSHVAVKRRNALDIPGLGIQNP